MLQNFVENFSEFSAAQRNAGKHVTIMSELSRLVDTRTLMQVHTNPCCLTGISPYPPPRPSPPPSSLLEHQTGVGHPWQHYLVLVANYSCWQHRSEHYTCACW